MRNVSPRIPHNPQANDDDDDFHYHWYCHDEEYEYVYNHDYDKEFLSQWWGAYQKGL